MLRAIHPQRGTQNLFTGSLKPQCVGAGYNSGQYSQPSAQMRPTTSGLKLPLGSSFDFTVLIGDWQIAMRTFALLLTIFLTGCVEAPHAVWNQHAYVWSRNTSSSVLKSPQEITALRVLAAQWTMGDGDLWVLTADLPHAANSSRPVIVVVRLDGHAITVPAHAVVETLRLRWPRWEAGRHIAAVEIDHDSATARLGDYTKWLRAFQEAWGDTSPVWITALPDWRHSSELPELLNSVDTYTLQVHAIDAQSPGLVDVSKAMDWVSQFERLSDTDHFVALPTYALRVGLGGDGEVRFIEAENRVGASAAHERLLFTDPFELAGLAKSLRDTRMASRLGIAWFRLPDEKQRNTMSRDTFDQLVSGGVLERNVLVIATPVSASAATFDIVLRNAGRHDTGLPRALHLAEGCEAGDVSAGYRADTDRQTLIRQEEGLLRSGESRSIGWIRCAGSSAASAQVSW